VPNFFIFLPRTLLGRLTLAIQGPGVPSPQEECPFHDKFLAMLICRHTALTIFMFIYRCDDVSCGGRRVFQPVRWRCASYFVDRARRIDISRSLRRRTDAVEDAVSTVTWNYLRKFTARRNVVCSVYGLCRVGPGRLFSNHTR